jgi:uncharacterized membrane protein
MNVMKSPATLKPNPNSAAAIGRNWLFELITSHRLLAFLLAFWLGGSLMLDLLVMPTLYRMGMMQTASFASVGEALFSAFNEFELIFAAIVLSSVLAHRNNEEMEAHHSLGGLGLPILLLGIVMIFRYALTPLMAGLGVQLDWLTVSEMPASMNWFHVGYWGLEMVKIAGLGVLLNRCFR